VAALSEDVSARGRAGEKYTIYPGGEKRVGSEKIARYISISDAHNENMKLVCDGGFIKIYMMGL
jgi:hypothetical protein